MTENNPPTATESTTPAAAENSSKEARQWAMFLHFSLLAGFVIPFAGLIAPIVIWQLKKEELPEITAHAYVIFNWLLSALIYGAVSLILVIVLIGIVGLWAIGLMTVVYAIIGGIKANDGVLWVYPLSIQFFKQD